MATVPLLSLRSVSSGILKRVTIFPSVANALPPAAAATKVKVDSLPFAAFSLQLAFQIKEL